MATPAAAEPRHLAGLNAAQRDATTHGGERAGAQAAAPLLVLAGAGSGKTRTLASRVAHLLATGAEPGRVLLLTFSRRAATEMCRRVEALLPGGGAAASRLWAGTFHAIANRLLRLHAAQVGLSPSFTLLDRPDAEDLLDVLRHDLDLSRTDRRFPRKATCLSIYSWTVNAQRPLERCLKEAFPWCEEWAPELRRLFGAYVEAKTARQVLDYDDLLLYWFHLMTEPPLAKALGERFDHVLVDEFQDTNVLQSEILLRLKPDGRGVTVVGDDAQAIYSFRAAAAENILRFPQRFEPPARVVVLDRSYRSTQPVLDAANAVMALAPGGLRKRLVAVRPPGPPPRLVVAEDEAAEVDYVVRRILELREEGLSLRDQAVLFRAGHHADALEVELSRRKIPYVKYGGLRFLEAAHVKDLLAILRWGQNPADQVAAFRVLRLLPGVGPATARRVGALLEARCEEGSVAGVPLAALARQAIAELCGTLAELRAPASSWPAHVGRARAWYDPHLQRVHEHAPVRASDLDQLEQLASQFPSCERFLSELTLDPPHAAGDLAGSPHLDDDWLVLSTIHSAKGQEWEAVYVLHAADGCIPSDLATGAPEQLEEERRLLYVAMTRARTRLEVVHPVRFFVRQQHRHGDRHVLAPRTRFLPEEVAALFEPVAHGRPRPQELAIPGDVRVDVAARLRASWG